MRTHYSRMLSLILAAGVSARVFASQFQGVNLDEGNYLADANNILAGLVPFRDYLSREPIFSYLLAMTVDIGGRSLFLARTLPILAGTVTTVLIVEVARRVAGNTAGLLGGVLYATSPYIISWGTILKLEPLGSMFGIAAILVILEGHSRKSIGMTSLAGGLLAIGVLSRRSEVAIFLGLTVFLLWKGNLTNDRKARKRLLSYLISFMAVFTAAITPFIILTSPSWVWSAFGAGEAVQANSQSLIVKLKVLDSMFVMEGLLFVLLLSAGLSVATKLPNLWKSSVHSGLLMILSLFLATSSFIGAAGFGVLWYPSEWNYALIAFTLTSLLIIALHVGKQERWFPHRPLSVIALPLASLAGLYVIYGLSIGIFVDYLNDFTPMLCVLAGVSLSQVSIPILRNSALSIPRRALIAISLVGLAIFPGLILSPINPYNTPYAHGLGPYNLYERTYPPSIVNSVSSYLQLHDPQGKPIFTADTIFPAVAGLPTIGRIAYPMWYVSRGPVTNPVNFRPFSFDPFDVMPTVSDLALASNEAPLAVIAYRTRLLLAAQPLLQRYVAIYFSPVATFSDINSIDDVVIMQRRSDSTNANLSQELSQNGCANCFTTISGSWNLSNNSLISTSASTSGNRSLVLFRSELYHYGVLQLNLSISGEGGVVVNYWGVDNYTYVRLIKSPNFDGVQVIQITNQTQKLVAQYYTKTSGGYHSLKMVYFPTILQLFLDDVPVLKAEVAVQDFSQVGLMANYGASFYSFAYSTSQSSVLFDATNY